MAEVLKHDRLKEFEEVALPHLPLLYNFTLKMTRDEKDAENILQETYYRAFRAFHQFTTGTNCRAWLFKILNNIFINAYHKRVRDPSFLDPSLIEIAANASHRRDPNAYSDEVEAEVLGKALDEEVGTALQSLSPEFRSPIILSDIEGFSYEEIAKILEAPLGTIKSRIHRGRRLLASSLRLYASQMGYPELQDDRSKD